MGRIFVYKSVKKEQKVGLNNAKKVVVLRFQPFIYNSIFMSFGIEYS